jgi:hypothetical protein
VLEELDKLSTKEKTQLALEAMAAAMQAMRDETEAIQVQLDESTVWCSLKKFNAMHKLGYTPRELGSISRSLGLLGYERNKITEDPNFASGVWAYRIFELEKYFESTGVLI